MKFREEKWEVFACPQCEHRTLAEKGEVRGSVVYRYWFENPVGKDRFCFTCGSMFEYSTYPKYTKVKQF